MHLFSIIVLLFYIGTTQASLFGNIQKTLQNYLRTDDREGHLNNIDPQLKRNLLKYPTDKISKISDTGQAINKAQIIEAGRRLEEHLNHGKDFLMKKLTGSKISKYDKKPGLNNALRSNQQNNARRHDDTTDTSSSIEMTNWKEEFDNQWMIKKFEAVNSTNNRGDVVNMVAARPWGVPCGDPNQHDMPWGTCMLAMECDSEYRIYRGDIFCGRTQFVCCSLLLTNYDLYQGFDISFADTSFSTDSAEKKHRERGSKENKKRKRNREKIKRLKERRRRKRQMKKNIRRIVHEIRKILNRSFRNSSQHRKRRTQLLKKYIRDLKKQYRKDRKAVRDIHLNDMDRVDERLEKKLQQIKNLNHNFLTNETFREIVVNGSISKEGARMLAQAYPELKNFLRGYIRRDDGGLVGVETNEQNDYLAYDIEYGALYY